jgi:hypothetical protein
MRRIAIAASFTGAAILIARALGAKLHERVMAACGRMFKQMPDDAPPKRVMRGIEEIRVKTARILELLEEREQVVGEPEPLGEVSPARAVGHAP